MFGVKMAKSFMKKAKKAVKSAKKEAKSQVSEAKSEVKAAVKEVKKVSSSARDHIESLAHYRRDAAIMWGKIKNGNLSDSEIKKIAEESGFSQLLSEIS